jgi:DNA-binding NarL/FixJ family response regulator
MSKKPVRSRRRSRASASPERGPDSSLAAPAGSRLKIGVASGPALYREILCRALAAEPGIEVAGGTAQEDDVAALLDRGGLQVLLFDYEALGPNGESAIARLRRRAPKTRILVLATRSGPETVESVLRAGASGLVGKESNLATVVRAIRAVAAGEIWANRRVTAIALENLADASHRRSGAGGLTEREAEVVAWVTRGLRNKEIAHRLAIHEKTVKTHLNNIFRKLKVESRVALALQGMVDIQPKT